MIPSMTLETYLAGWGAVDRDRQAVARQILKLCSAMRRSVRGEAGGLLAQRLAVALRDDGVSEVAVDDTVARVANGRGQHALTLTRSPCGAAVFAITTTAAAAGQHRPMRASGRLTLDREFKVMLNVGKGTHVFAQCVGDAALRLQPAAVAPLHSGYLAA